MYGLLDLPFSQGAMLIECDQRRARDDTRGLVRISLN